MWQEMELTGDIMLILCIQSLMSVCVRQDFSSLTGWITADLS
jgi:hypothetical protein